MQAAWIPSKKPKKGLGFSRFFLIKKKKRGRDHRTEKATKRPISWRQHEQTAHQETSDVFGGSWFTHQMHQTMKTRIKQILLIPRICCSLAIEKKYKKKTQQNKCQRYGSGQGDGVFSRPVLSKQNRWVFKHTKIRIWLFYGCPHAIRNTYSMWQRKAFCFQVPSLPWLIVARNKNQIFDDSKILPPIPIRIRVLICGTMQWTRQNQKMETGFMVYANSLKVSVLNEYNYAIHWPCRISTKFWSQNQTTMFLSSFYNSKRKKNKIRAMTDISPNVRRAIA